MTTIPKHNSLGRNYGHDGWFFQYGVWDLRVDCPKCNQFEAWYLNGYTCVNESGVVSDPGPCRKCGFTDMLYLEGCTPKLRGMEGAYRKELIDYAQTEAYRRYKEKEMNPKPPTKTWSDLPPTHQSRYINIGFQHGPVIEVGVNGCQVVDVAQVLVERLNALQSVGPCRENALAITKIEEAIHWLNHRSTNDIIASGPIEGAKLGGSGGKSPSIFPGPSGQVNSVPFSPDITSPPKP